MSFCCCPLTSKSTDIFVLDGFHVEMVLDLCILYIYNLTSYIYIFLLTLYFKDQFSLLLVLLSSKSKLFTHHGTHAVGDVTIKVIWILLAYWQLLLVLINYILMSYSPCNHSLILNLTTALPTVDKQQIRFSLRQKSVTIFSCMIVQRLPICFLN